MLSRHHNYTVSSSELDHMIRNVIQLPNNKIKFSRVTKDRTSDNLIQLEIYEGKEKDCKRNPIKSQRMLDISKSIALKLKHLDLPKELNQKPNIKKRMHFNSKSILSKNQDIKKIRHLLNKSVVVGLKHGCVYDKTDQIQEVSHVSKITKQINKHRNKKLIKKLKQNKQTLDQNILVVKQMQPIEQPKPINKDIQHLFTNK